MCWAGGTEEHLQALFPVHFTCLPPPSPLLITACLAFISLAENGSKGRWEIGWMERFHQNFYLFKRMSQESVSVQINPPKTCTDESQICRNERWYSCPCIQIKIYFVDSVCLWGFVLAKWLFFRWKQCFLFCFLAWIHFYVFWYFDESQWAWLYKSSSSSRAEVWNRDLCFLRAGWMHLSHSHVLWFIHGSHLNVMHIYD